MCCFSRPVPHVSSTRIFARGLEDGRQALVYEMSVEVLEDLAMVLPLPVPARSPEDAVELVDLSGYPTFFADLGSAFPAVMMPARQSFGLAAPPAPAPLKVQDVGDFEASFVPTLADFSRLDPRFRLPDAVWSSIPQVANDGFAVFKLKPKAERRSKTQTIHPMAMRFPRRDVRAIYFPTLHVHDGTFAPSAAFDHTLYCQPTELLAHLFGWGASHAPLGTRVDAARARGLVDGAAYGFQLGVLGELANEDVWLREPDDVTVADLTGAGRTFLARVSVGRGFGAPLPAGDFGGDHLRRERAWRETSRLHAGKLARGIRAGLLQLEQSRGAELGLGDFSWQLPSYFMNGPQLWSGTSYLDGSPAPQGGGRGRIQLTPFTDKVEPQTITLAFTKVPDQRGIQVIEAELRRILDASIQ